VKGDLLRRVVAVLARMGLDQLAMVENCTIDGVQRASTRSPRNRQGSE